MSVDSSRPSWANLNTGAGSLAKLQCCVQIPQTEQHDDGYNPTNYYRNSMDGKRLHASGNSADDLTELAERQPEVSHMLLVSSVLSMHTK